MTAPTDRIEATHAVGRDWDVKALELKLEAARREHEAAQGEAETIREMLRSDVEHRRGLTTQQSDTIQNLTEEIKGLTIALHHE